MITSPVSNQPSRRRSASSSSTSEEPLASSGGSTSDHSSSSTPHGATRKQVDRTTLILFMILLVEFVNVSPRLHQFATGGMASSRPKAMISTAHNMMSKASLSQNQKTRSLREQATNRVNDTALEVKGPEVIPHLWNKLNVGSPLWQNDLNVVHVLSSRIQQHQPNLVHLGKARLELFKTFTLPSITSQTTQQFLWIIFTDPKLRPILRRELVDLVKPHPNIILLGLNQAFDDFRSNEWIQQVQSVMAGDWKKLLAYHKAAQSHILIETRLDADDAIYIDMMKSLQHQVKATIGKKTARSSFGLGHQKAKTWSVLCVEKHLEWGYLYPWAPKTPSSKNTTTHKEKIQKGHLIGATHPEYCVTPGLTYAYQVGVTPRDFPSTKAHHALHRRFPICGSPLPFASDEDNTANRVLQTNCLGRIRRLDGKKFDEHMALRSRTPTSVGMKGVIPTNAVKKNQEWKNKQDTVWDTVVEQNFGIPPASVWQLRKALHSNITDILRDAVAGQIESAHFVETNSLATLKKFLAKYEQE